MADAIRSIASATTNPNPNEVLPDLPEDPGKAMMTLLIQNALKTLKTGDCSPAFLEFTRKLLQDNAVTLSAVRRGDFGKVYQAAAEQFPFPDEAVLSN